MRDSPATPFVRNDQSRPAEANRSYMPYSAEAVTSGIAKMATFTFPFVPDMAEMAGLLPLRL